MAANSFASNTGVSSGVCPANAVAASMSSAMSAVVRSQNRIISRRAGLL